MNQITFLCEFKQFYASLNTRIGRERFFQHGGGEFRQGGHPQSCSDCETNIGVLL